MKGKMPTNLVTLPLKRCGVYTRISTNSVPVAKILQHTNNGCGRVRTMQKRGLESCKTGVKILVTLKICYWFPINVKKRIFSLST